VTLGVIGTAIGWPSVAVAEVMDKETVPWSPMRVLATLLVTSICAALMRLAQRRGSRRRGALVTTAATLGLAWAIAGAFDDFHSLDVGREMRDELGCLAAAYEGGLLLESAAPILVVLAVRLGGLRAPG
jgi:hypothetical protein